MIKQEEIYQAYKRQLEKLSKIAPCRYTVERYYRSHRQLIISATSKRNVEIKSETLYAHFIAVEYMSLIPFWDNVEFSLVPINEIRQNLEAIGIFANGHEKNPIIVCADPPGFHLYIVCHILQVLDKMPEIYAYHLD